MHEVAGCIEEWIATYNWILISTHACNVKHVCFQTKFRWVGIHIRLV